MSISYRAALLVSFLVFSLSAVGQSSSEPSKAEIVTRIINQTAITSQVTQAPKEMQKQFASNPLGLEPSNNKQMIDLFSKAFIEDSLLVEVHNIFDEQYEAALAGPVFKWISEGNTQEVLEAEREFYTLQGSRQRIVRMYEIDQNPVSEERKAVIDSLIDATSAAESALESQVIIFRSIISAFSTLSDQQNFSDSQVDGIVSNYRFQIQSQIEQEVSKQFLIMYYQLDNKILSDYTSFFNSKAGRWLTTTSSESIHSAFQKAADRFVKSVKDAK